MKALRLMSLIGISFLFSCGSIEKLQPDNSILIKTNIQESGLTIQRKSGYSSTHNNAQDFVYNKYSDYKFFKNGFSKKNRSLTFEHPDYNPIEIKIKRTIRPLILSLDLIGAYTIILSPSLVIDILNGNMWKISKKSKNINLTFERSEFYFKKQLKQYYNFGTVSGMKEYIRKYSESPLIDSANTYINEFIVRDSIFDEIQKKGTYRDAEDFYKKYPNFPNTSKVKELIKNYFEKENNNSQFDWPQIGDFMRNKFTEYVAMGTKFAKDSMYSKSIENLDKALSIFMDKNVIIQKDSITNIIFNSILDNANSSKTKKRYEEALEYYKKAQKVKNDSSINNLLKETQKLIDTEYESSPREAIARKIRGNSYTVSRGSDTWTVSFGDYKEPQTSGDGSASCVTKMKISGNGTYSDKYYDSETNYVTHYYITTSGKIEVTCTYRYGGRCFGGTLVLNYNFRRNSMD